MTNFKLRLTVGNESKDQELGFWRDFAVEQFRVTRDRLCDRYTGSEKWILELIDTDGTVSHHFEKP